MWPHAQNPDTLRGGQKADEELPWPSPFTLPSLLLIVVEGPLYARHCPWPRNI